MSSPGRIPKPLGFPESAAAPAPALTGCSGYVVTVDTGTDGDDVVDMGGGCRVRGRRGRRRRGGRRRTATGVVLGVGGRDVVEDGGGVGVGVGVGAQHPVTQKIFVLMSDPWAPSASTVSLTWKPSWGCGSSPVKV